MFLCVVKVCVSHKHFQIVPFAYRLIFFILFYFISFYPTSSLYRFWLLIVIFFYSNLHKTSDSKRGKKEREKHYTCPYLERTNGDCGIQSMANCVACFDTYIEFKGTQSLLSAYRHHTRDRTISKLSQHSTQNINTNTHTQLTI